MDGNGNVGEMKEGRRYCEGRRKEQGWYGRRGGLVGYGNGREGKGRPSYREE